jgi:phosphatidylserine/phosphatidylglycerophosphate/cardiolipin synthase-like enzyme
MPDDVGSPDSTPGSGKTIRRHCCTLYASWLRAIQGTLADALQAALQRGVNVDVVGTGQGLQTLDTTWLSQNAQGRLRLFQPKENMTDAQRLGSHAKFCVADGLSAYVGSANLTAPGLGRHLEMGLLVQGEVARQIEDFWIYALEIELFIPVT